MHRLNEWTRNNELQPVVRETPLTGKSTCVASGAREARHQRLSARCTAQTKDISGAAFGIQSYKAQTQGNIK